MRRVFGDAVISFGAVLALLVMLVSVDPRVRYQLSSTWNGTGARSRSTAAGRSSHR